MTASFDLLERAATLVDIPSVSHEEEAIADYVQSVLAGGAFEVVRIGNNVVARTDRGGRTRVVLAGHLDTVPPQANEKARIEDGVLFGLGSADMKGGIAVLLALAERVETSRYDTTIVCYACEEVARTDSGLRVIEAERPELLRGDVALLLEPTDGFVEAGCQGVVRVRLDLEGVAAHVARPQHGRNAIHRLSAILERINSYKTNRPVVDGCEFAESLQAVRVVGGRADNVVPDHASLVVSYRFAPDQTPDEATTTAVAMFEPFLNERGDLITVVDLAPAAPPALKAPLLRRLVEMSERAPRAKLGWTDVAFFAERGIPATNFGPGDPELAHRKDEWVSGAALDRVYGILEQLLSD